MNISNTIQRQQSEPILAKACNVIRHYGKATDCLITVLDPDYNAIEVSVDPISTFFCSVCKQYRGQHCGIPASGEFTRQQGGKPAPGEFPCSDKHKNAVSDSCSLGGSNIYLCDLGFFFWTSPFFSGEQFAGAAIGSRGLGITEEQATENILKISGGEIPGTEIKQYLNGFPSKSYDDVKAMAQMMMLCADQLSVKYFTEEMIFSETDEPLSCKTFNNSASSTDKDNEIKLLASLRRGDREEARKILDELLERHMSNNSFETLQMRTIEIAAFISRAAAKTENVNISDLLEENDKYLKRIEEAHTVDEISEVLDMGINLMAGKMFSFQGVLHSSALRKAERFIWRNYSRKISLKEIADAAGLSPPYFSTIFKEEMGIHLSHYLNRLRVAKAAAKLVDTSHPISRIAETCGFEDQSWFSKVFKSHTGMSPGKYREQGGLSVV